jgi:hypothetical protein
MSPKGILVITGLDEEAMTNDKIVIHDPHPQGATTLSVVVTFEDG